MNKHIIQSINTFDDIRPIWWDNFASVYDTTWRESSFYIPGTTCNWTEYLNNLMGYNFIEIGKTLNEWIIYFNSAEEELAFIMKWS